MGVPYSTSYWPKDPLTSLRPTGFAKSGYKNRGYERAHPSAYNGAGGTAKPFRSQNRLNPAAWNGYDVPTARPYSEIASAAQAKTIVGQAAYNRCYRSFVESARGQQASLGVALAEWGETAEMVASRSLQAFRLARSLIRGDLRGVAANLSKEDSRLTGGTRSRKISRAMKHAASGYLEKSFGWDNLIRDIQDGCAVFSQPLPGGRAKGYSGKVYKTTDVTSGDFRWLTHYIGSVRCQGEVFVTNPNLYLLQQLGLANPLSIGADLIPFSFVADWAFDYSTYLGSLTDFLGCTVHDAFTSTKVVGRTQQTNNRIGANFDVSAWHLDRALGLPQPLPNLDFFANVGRSWRRAANGAALLGQLLTGHHK